MITIPWWLAVLGVACAWVGGYVVSGWFALRRANGAMDRLLARETRLPVINDETAADRGEASGG